MSSQLKAAMRHRVSCVYGKRVKITDGPLYQSPFTHCKHALTYITRKSMLISRSYVL